ncbi:MAG TPA: PAS domain S-box protein, partial [Candidatus Methylacidiphilales bacterium]
AFPLLRDRAARRDHWLALPAFVLAATAACILWGALRASEEKALRVKTRAALENIGSGIVDHVESRLRLVNRFAERWERHGGLPRADWEGDAASYLRDEPGLHALEWADAGLRLRWLAPPAGEGMADPEGSDLRRDPPAAVRAREEAVAGHRLAVSEPFALRQGWRGFLAYRPLYVRDAKSPGQERFDGLLVGVFHVDLLVGATLSAQDRRDYGIVLSDGKGTIFGAAPPDAVRAETQGTVLRFAGNVWRLEVTPTRDFVLREKGRLASIVLFLGFVAAAALAAAVLLWQQARDRIDSARRANRDLAAEVLEHERTAHHLRESEERFRQAFEFAGIGVALVALDGRFRRVNRSLCELVGYEEAELMARTFQDITHPDDLDADLRQVLGLLSGAYNHYKMEKRYIHKKGHSIWIRLTASLLRDEQGKPLEFVAQIEDITARRRAEERLARQNAALEAASAKAHEASRLKSEFLANMSHELRTPLNGIIGFCEMLYDRKLGPLNDDQRGFLGDVLESSRHLLGLINGILDLAKIEAGRMELAPEPFSLPVAIAEVVRSLQAHARKRSLAISTRIDLDGDAVHLDPQKVKEILFNLLSNAVKFTPDGKRIEVSAASVGGGQGDDGWVELSVRDSGIGIKPEDISRLFRDFEQLDGGPTRRHKGTGLGLALTRKLVVLHGGTIRAESVFGEGSLFVVRLPRDVRKAVPSTAQG